FYSFFLLIARPLRSTLFPYTTLFRSKNHENIENPIVRDNYIIFSGTLGLVINIFLFALKLIIGLIMSSIAIVSDSFNNLSDCLTDRKSTRLNSSHVSISYAVFCLKKN